MRTGAPGQPARGDAAWKPSPLYLTLAAACAVGGLGGAALFFWTGAPPPAPATSPPAPLAVLALPAEAAPHAGARTPAVVTVPTSAMTQVAASAGAVPPARSRDAGGDPTPDIADFLQPGEKPSMAEVIARLHAAGVHGGLGAFQPPGTRPPLIGLAVPEDFALPEGYVRHYQATDDGQRIEPILMFAPDRAFVDATGRPYAVPADRVVPPEMAPPGLPIRRIVVPAPRDEGR